MYFYLLWTCGCTANQTDEVRVSLAAYLAHHSTTSAMLLALLRVTGSCSARMRFRSLGAAQHVPAMLYGAHPRYFRCSCGILKASL